MSWNRRTDGQTSQIQYTAPKLHCGEYNHHLTITISPASRDNSSGFRASNWYKTLYCFLGPLHVGVCFSLKKQQQNNQLTIIERCQSKNDNTEKHQIYFKIYGLYQ